MDSQDGSTTSTPPLSPPRPGSPLCLFYFSHPFRVVAPEQAEDEVFNLPMARRRRAALEDVVKKRQRILQRRRKSAQHRRVWRRYLREPFWDLRTCLFANTVGTNTSTVPSLDEVLTTIRKAWEPPRCLALERDPGFVKRVEKAGMGTGQGMSRKQVPANPGLPHRRYSVPETVMRKYSLNKQLSGSSDSGVATVPVVTPDTISSSPLSSNKSSPDSSDHSMGNRSSKKPRTRKSPSHSESVTNDLRTRSTLDTVSEEANDSAKGKASGDTLYRVSSLREDFPSAPVSSKSKSSSGKQQRKGTRRSPQDSVEHISNPQTPAEESRSESTSNQDAPPSSVREEVTSSQTLNIPSTESKQGSPEVLVTGDTPEGSDIPEEETKSESPESTEEETKTDSPEGRSTAEEETKTDSPEGRSTAEEETKTDSPEPRSSTKDELSSSQTLGVGSIDSRTQSAGNNVEDSNTTESLEPQSSGKEDLSSSQTPGIASTESKPVSTPSEETNKVPRNSIDSTEPKSSGKDELSSSQTLGVESIESRSQSDSKKETGGQSPPDTTESIEPQSSVRDELSSTQTGESLQTNSDTKQTAKRESLSKGTVTRRTSSLGVSPLDTEETPEPVSSPRDELSSSQTVGVGSTESRQGRTRSSTPGGDISFTPTECCVSTPDPERSQSMSSDRASESCSITPVEQTSQSSGSGSSPERPSVTLRSSPDQPSSDHTFSTQDTTLSIKSESIILGRPVSVLARRNDSSKQTQVSDSEQSIGHIEFMNENVDNESHPLLSVLSRNLSKGSSESMKLEKSQSTDSNSQQTAGDSGHATEPECKLGDEFCGSSRLNDSSPKLEVNPLSESVPSGVKDSMKCKHQSRAWEIIIQPTTIVQQNSAPNCSGDGSCGIKEQHTDNQLAILPSKNQDGEFCSTKTYLVIRPGGTPLSGQDKRHPLTANHDIEVLKTPSSSSRSDDSVPYNWSRLTDEERAVRMQHQRHRLWMNRRLSAANALPSSPLHGALSYGMGTGSTYRKSADIQLVVPRYSALPRSVSMLVNTSSGECSSNSNSDSECLSLVDSLEERPSHKPTKHDSKPVRGDIVQLLPEQTTSKHDLHNRINPATPRGKGKAFFVSMAGGLDEAGKVEVLENVEKPIVSQSMPDRLRKKLSQRHQLMELKKKKKKHLKGQGEDTENIPHPLMKDTIESQMPAVIPINTTKSILQNTQNTLIKKKELPEQQVLTQAETSLADKNISKKYQHRRRESTSQPILNENKGDHGKVQVDIPIRVRKMTSTFYPVTQGSSNGTFIVSKKEAQEEEEPKPPEEELFVDTTNTLGIDQMVKKEDIPEERSPPVKRFKASRKKTPPKKERESPEDFLTSLKSSAKSNENTHEGVSTTPQTPEKNEVNENVKSVLENNVKKTKEYKTTDKKISKSNGKGEKNHKKSVPIDSSPAEDLVQEEGKANIQVPISKTSSIKKKVQKDQNSPKENLKSEKIDDSKCNKVTKKESKSENTVTDEKKLENKIKHHNERKLKNDQQLVGAQNILNRSQSLQENLTVTDNHDKSSKQTEVPEENKGKENNEKIKTNSNQAKKTESGSEVTKNKNKSRKDKEKEVEKIVNPPIDTVQYQHSEHGNSNNENTTKVNVDDRKGNLTAKEKANNTVSCQTSPQLKTADEKSTSAPDTPPKIDAAATISPPESASNHPTLQIQPKSGIPVMKSPIGTRKLSPDTAITLQQQSMLKNSHLPVRKTSRLLHPPPVRRSANLLGTRFHQRFEVIPEERSVSLESSTEDQTRQAAEKARRASLPAGQLVTKPERANIVPHNCLSYNQPSSNPVYTKYRQNLGNLYRQSALSKQSSSSNYDESSSSSPNPNGSNESSSNEITNPVVKRPMCQSKIPRAEKITRQTKVSELAERRENTEEETKPSQDYQGKAALAPHNEDKDLLSISKGWINFYLLKDGRGTPDSICSEAPSEKSEKEERLTRRKRQSPLVRTVTVVGGEENRIRQYTVQSRLQPSPEDFNKNKEIYSTLPDLNSNTSSRRHSLEKLPITVLDENSSPADSDHSTTYMCLPSPRFKRPNLLEGSGELACSESSVSSSSESESGGEGGPSVLPLRWPARLPRRGPHHHRSRSRTKNYKTEQFQSFYQNGGGGSAGWTVTVAGSNACPQQPPELEMRLTFPACARQPAASQSDSGLGEDNNGEKSKKHQPTEEETNQENDDDNEDDNEQSQHFLPPAQSAPTTHRWTVMLKNKNQGGAEIQKSGKRTYQCLPDLGFNPGQNKNSKKAIKRSESSFPVTSLGDEDSRKSKKFSALWPKVQKIIESKVIIRKSSGHISQEVKSVSQLLENEDGAVVVRSGLAIKGSAITPEKKPRVPTMSERDLTRNNTAKR